MAATIVKRLKDTVEHGKCRHNNNSAFSNPYTTHQINIFSCISPAGKMYSGAPRPNKRSMRTGTEFPGPRVSH